MCLTTGNQIRIIKGKPQHEGQYKISIVLVSLTDDGPDSQLFTKEPLGDVLVNMEDTGAKLKQLSHDFYIKEHPNTCLDFEDFKLRNPMNDIGTIIQSTDLLENLYLYDGKEIYLHMS